MTLAGKVAFVTGASRGVGRGVALGLGESGATVYVTGRTSSRDDRALPGTIEFVAQEVDAAGGRGIPVRWDRMNQVGLRGHDIAGGYRSAPAGEG